MFGYMFGAPQQPPKPPSPLTDEEYQQNEFPGPTSEQIITEVIYSEVLKKEHLQLYNQLDVRILKISTSPDPQTMYELDRILEKKLEAIFNDISLLTEIIRIYGAQAGLDKIRIDFLIECDLEEIQKILIAKARAEEAAVRLWIMVLDFLNPEKKREYFANLTEDFTPHKDFLDPDLAASPLVQERLNILQALEFLGRVISGLEPRLSKLKEPAERISDLLDKHSTNEKVELRAFQALMGLDDRGQRLAPRNGTVSHTGIVRLSTQKQI